MIEPLDVCGFRIWKNYVKHFSDSVLLMNEYLRAVILTWSQIISKIDLKLKGIQIQQLLGAPGARNVCTLNIFAIIVITVQIVARNNSESLYKF